MHDMKKVRQAFNSHRNGAKTRGIEFNFTFYEWWELWKPHWASRGRGRNQLMMCRKMDNGAYEVGNVRIATAACNGRDRAYVNHDRQMKIVKEEALAELAAHEYDDGGYDDEDNPWLPDEMKNPYKSSADLIY
jgi:hypothetical protein